MRRWVGMDGGSLRLVKPRNSGHRASSVLRSDALDSESRPRIGSGIRRSGPRAKGRPTSERISSAERFDASTEPRTQCNAGKRRRQETEQSRGDGRRAINGRSQIHNVVWNQYCGTGRRCWPFCKIKRVWTQETSIDKASFIRLG